MGGTEGTLLGFNIWEASVVLVVFYFLIWVVVLVINDLKFFWCIFLYVYYFSIVKEEILMFYCCFFIYKQTNALPKDRTLLFSQEIITLFELTP